MITFPLVTDRVVVRPFADGDDVAMREIYGDPMSCATLPTARRRRTPKLPRWSRLPAPPP